MDKKEDNAGKIYYFAYGSNMNEDDLKKWCNAKGHPLIKLENGKEAILENYKLVFNIYSETRCGAVANIEQNNEESVRGVLFETYEDDLIVLDRKEQNYVRREVKVKTINESQQYDAITYIANKKKGGILPSKDYLGIIVEGAKKYNLNQEWMRKLDQQPTWNGLCWVVKMGHKEDLGKRIIRISELSMGALSFKEGDIGKLINPKNGARFYGKVMKAEKNKGIKEYDVGISSHIRSLLQCELDDHLNLHKPQDSSKWRIGKSGPWQRNLTWLVGSRWVDLRVVKGEDSDEGSNTSRVRDDVLALLGIEKGDEVEIIWRQNHVNCRVIPVVFPSKYVKQEESEGIIQICQSERDELDLDKGDVVQVRRRPWFILQKNADRLIASVASVVAAFLAASAVPSLVNKFPILGNPIEIVITLGISMTGLAWLFFLNIRSQVYGGHANKRKRKTTN